MRIVPEHKLDFEACSALAAAEDFDVVNQLDELLVWLQDMNWPVARLVEARIKSLGLALVDPVRKVLRGSDDIWKHWLVSSLLQNVEPSVVRKLREDLHRIISTPTAGEIKEGVVDAAYELKGVWL